MQVTPHLVAGLPRPALGRFTTRQGGTSTGSWASYDLALHVGDDPALVEAHRGALAADLGATLVWAEQVHGRGVAVVDRTTPEVADGAGSVIVEQVANGVTVRMAVLYLLLSGEMGDSGGHHQTSGGPA